MNRQPLRRFLCFAFAVACLAPWPLVARADAAFDGMSTVDEATAKMPGLRGDRARAIAWLAAFNALDAIDPRYRPYPPAPSAWPADAAKPSREAALAAALHTVLVLEPDADQALLVRRHRDTLTAVKAAGEREAGAILGQQAALMLLASRSADRLGRVEPRASTAVAGVFVELAGAKMPRSIAPASLAPFGIRSAAAFDPGPPPAVGSETAAREIADVRAVGGATSTVRSSEQTGAALFWVANEPTDFSAWLNSTLEARNLDALDVARVAALDAMIGIDVAIVGTVLKERYLHWRPETAIAGPFATDRDAARQPMVRAPDKSAIPVDRCELGGTSRSRAAAPLRRRRPDRAAQQPDAADAALAERGGARRRPGHVEDLGRCALSQRRRGRASRRAPSRDRDPRPPAAAALRPDRRP